MFHSRLKRATESKPIDHEQRKDVCAVSIQNSAKPNSVRKMSKKDAEEINPLLAKEVPHTVRFFIILMSGLISNF